jgi:hypothetical protein
MPVERRPGRIPYRRLHKTVQVDTMVAVFKPARYSVVILPWLPVKNMHSREKFICGCVLTIAAFVIMVIVLIALSRIPA